MTVNETIVTGRKFRKCADATNKLWQRISFWTKSSDVEFEDGKTAEAKLGAINGITDSLDETSSNLAASAKAVATLNQNFGGVQLRVSNDEVQWRKAGADTWNPFANFEEKNFFYPPILTEDGVLGGKTFAVSADSILNSRGPYRLFTEYGNLWQTSAKKENYLILYNPLPFRLLEFILREYADSGTGSPSKTIKASASDNGEEWKTFNVNFEFVAGAGSSRNGRLHRYKLFADKKYKYYKFTFTSSTATSTMFSQLLMVAVL